MSPLRYSPTTRHPCAPAHAHLRPDTDARKAAPPMHTHDPSREDPAQALRPHARQGTGYRRLAACIPSASQSSAGRTNAKISPPTFMYRRGLLRPTSSKRKGSVRTQPRKADASGFRMHTSTNAHRPVVSPRRSRLRRLQHRAHRVPPLLEQTALIGQGHRLVQVVAIAKVVAQFIVGGAKAGC